MSAKPSSCFWVKSLGVEGDARQYSNVLAESGRETIDFMTAWWAHPQPILCKKKLRQSGGVFYEIVPNLIRHYLPDVSSLAAYQMNRPKAILFSTSAKL